MYFRNPNSAKLTEEFLRKRVFEDAKTLEEIGTEVGVSRRTVSDYCSKYKIDVTKGHNWTKYSDMVGKKINRLTIKSILMEKKKRSRFICECECGKIKTIDCSAVKRENTKSCGCYYDEYKEEKYYMDIHLCYYNGLRWSSKTRNIKFDISIEDIWNKYLQQDRKCALSGLEINFSRYRDRTTTASVDRIDSEKDYTMDNIQIVHKLINKMKSDLTNEEFICFCNMVSKNKPRTIQYCEDSTGRKTYQKVFRQNGN